MPLSSSKVGGDSLATSRSNAPVLPRAGRNYPTSDVWVYHLLAMLGGRSSAEWIAQYSSSHQHPVNRACHTLGIPAILLSAAIFVAGIFVHRLWLYAAGLFLVGWMLQFAGHAVEGKPPEFFHDWRFLFVGVRWWWAKVRGRA